MELVNRDHKPQLHPNLKEPLLKRKHLIKRSPQLIILLIKTSLCSIILEVLIQEMLEAIIPQEASSGLAWDQPLSINSRQLLKNAFLIQLLLKI